MIDILIVPDAHIPCEHRGAVRQLSEFAKTNRPRVTVVLGDLYDEYLLSRFTKNPDKVDQRIIKDGKKRGLEFLQKLRKATKDKVYFLPGNHEDRLQARLSENLFLAWWLGPQKQEIPEGIEWIEARELQLTTAKGSVYFTHGWRTREMAGNAAQSMVRDQSVVVGHTHKLALAWRTAKHFAIEAGWLGDESQYAFAYKMGRGAGCFDWTRGFAYLDELGMPYIRKI